MIEAIRADKNTIRTAYDRRSGLYDKLVAPMEWPVHLMAIDRLDPKPGEAVLDVAPGPGRSTVEIAARVGPDTIVHAVDLSPGMLALANERVTAAGLGNVALREGDASALPFPDGAFDALYNAYMLDLIPLAQMGKILDEFFRVLKPGGRVVLLDMSKPKEKGSNFREVLYRILPAKIVLYLGGGCRPVLMADQVRRIGFVDVGRAFITKPVPSEIVIGFRPQGSAL